MKIPLVKPDLPDYRSIEDRVREVLKTGKITNFGTYVHELEEACSEYLGCNAVSVSSGTIGLVLALQAAGLVRGQRVVLPSFTFTACGQAVLYAGGIPMFIDIGSDLTLSVEDLQVALSGRPDIGAVLPVHLFGHPCSVGDLEEVSRDYSRRVRREVPVVYDAAHAFGSAVGGRKVGGFGKAEVFSLSATKPFTTGEGGLVSSRDSAFLAKIRCMRNYGIGPNGQGVSLGLNGKMSELHAIVGLANLGRLEEFITRRVESANYLREQIVQHTSLAVVSPQCGVSSTHKDFVVLMPECRARQRSSLIEFLKQRGIETRTYFDPPLHEQACFREFCVRRLPHTEAFARRILTLPFFTTITKNEMDYLVACLGEWESNSV